MLRVTGCHAASASGSIARSRVTSRGITAEVHALVGGLPDHAVAGPSAELGADHELGAHPDHSGEVPAPAAAAASGSGGGSNGGCVDAQRLQAGQQVGTGAGAEPGPHLAGEPQGARRRARRRPVPRARGRSAPASSRPPRAPAPGGSSPSARSARVRPAGRGTAAAWRRSPRSPAGGRRSGRSHPRSRHGRRSGRPGPPAGPAAAASCAPRAAPRAGSARPGAAGRTPGRPGPPSAARHGPSRSAPGAGRSPAGPSRRGRPPLRRRSHRAPRSRSVGPAARGSSRGRRCRCGCRVRTVPVADDGLDAVPVPLDLEQPGVVGERIGGQRRQHRRDEPWCRRRDRPDRSISACPAGALLTHTAGASACTSSFVRPLRTLRGWSSASQPSWACASCLWISSHWSLPCLADAVLGRLPDAGRGPDQDEPAPQLLPVQDELQLAGLDGRPWVGGLGLGLPGAPVPDDDVAAAVLARRGSRPRSRSTPAGGPRRGRPSCAPPDRGSGPWGPPS